MPSWLRMGITEAFLQSGVCVRHRRRVGLTSICFGIFDASWSDSNCPENMGTELYELAWGVSGLRFHQKVSLSLLVRSPIPLRRGMRSQCLWTPLPLLSVPLKTACMMSGFRPILLGSRFNEKTPALWCKPYLFGFKQSGSRPNYSGSN